jgi:hypothetical protein
MNYDKIHGLKWDGAEIKAYTCPCGDCNNIVFEVTNCKTTVQLALTQCDLGHLIGELITLSNAVREELGGCKAAQ